MRSCIILTLLVVLAGCKPEDVPVESRLVRTLVVDPKPVGEDRHAIGEVKPRYESDLSFRVAGKVLSRLVDVGAWVKQGDTLATLDTQDYQNRLRSAEADVRAAEAALVEAQGTEARKAKLLKDGWTPQATYDTALNNLRAAEARLKAAKANRDLTRDQLNYTTLRADFDGVITAVGAEAGQNVSAGQMVVKLARPDDKDGVFNIAEIALTDVSDAAPRSRRLAAVQPGPDRRGRSAGDLSRRRSGDAHLHGQGHAEEPAAATSLRHEYRWPLERACRSRGRVASLRSIRKERFAGCLGA